MIRMLHQNLETNFSFIFLFIIITLGAMVTSVYKKGATKVKRAGEKESVINGLLQKSDLLFQSAGSFSQSEVSDVLELIDRVDDIDTNMFKIIGRTERVSNQSEPKEMFLNDSNLNAAQLLPKAFDIWSEKYR